MMKFHLIREKKNNGRSYRDQCLSIKNPTNLSLTHQTKEKKKKKKKQNLNPKQELSEIPILHHITIYKYIKFPL